MLALVQSSPVPTEQNPSLPPAKEQRGRHETTLRKWEGASATLGSGWKTTRLQMNYHMAICSTPMRCLAPSRPSPSVTLRRMTCSPPRCGSCKLTWARPSGTLPGCSSCRTKGRTHSSAAGGSWTVMSWEIAGWLRGSTWPDTSTPAMQDGASRS